MPIITYTCQKPKTNFQLNPSSTNYSSKPDTLYTSSVRLRYIRRTNELLGSLNKIIHVKQS